MGRIFTLRSKQGFHWEHINLSKEGEGSVSRFANYIVKLGQHFGDKSQYFEAKQSS